MALLEPDDGGVALIAKVWTAEYIQDEASRFQQFIAKWDRVLLPRMHLHAGIGAILFSLVSDSSESERPAPTAELLFRELSRWENYDVAPHLSEEELCIALHRAVEKLVLLNSVPCPVTKFRSHAWLGLDAMRSNLRKGIQWTVVSEWSGRSINALDQMDWADSICQQLAGKATVHGDAHLRNILLRGVEPFFIDYALSGPGHPCFDLARLSSALIMDVARMLGDEKEFSELLSAIVVEGASYEDVSRRFSKWFSSPVNRVVFGIGVKCRAAAVSVLMKYGGGIRDYVAVKFIIACQCVGVPGLQMGTARAMVRALAGYLRNDSASSHGESAGVR
ncbi:MAG: phosphotransferase [Polyangiaceae bacterium]|nr:phosphotransferase [Polyangiaceae bacterium]